MFIILKLSSQLTVEAIIWDQAVSRCAKLLDLRT